MFNRSPSTQARGTIRALVTPARVYALTRIALGAWLLFAPMQFGAKWFTAPQDPLLTASIVRSVGGRDAGIGVGLLLADRPRPWLLLCAFCDILDAGMVFLARGKFSEGDVVTGTAGALSYALVAIAIFGTRRQPRARRS